MTQPTALITGAGSGIGAATAMEFSKNGFNIVLNGRTEDKLEKVMAQLPPERTMVMSGDVSNADDALRVVDGAVERFGGLDTLVNNAAIARMGQAGDLSPDDWQQQMDINVGGVYNMSSAALPHLKADGGGSIVNTSSVSGLGGDWGMFGYNASKGAVSNMTRAMALDLGHQGVRVNAVAPSLTKTEMASGIFENDETYQKFLERLPMKRAAEPEDVARVIHFLASPAAGFVNGVVLPVDGGLSASNGQPNFS